MTHKSLTISDRVSAIFADDMRIDVASPDTDLLDTGLLDSLGVIELLTLIEKQFGITVEPDDLEIDNFRSINAITDFVRIRVGIPTDRCTAVQ